MFKRLKISKRILSGLLATTLLVTSFPVSATGGGHTGSGGDGGGSGGTSNNSIVYHTSTSGTKVSLLKVPVNKQKAKVLKTYNQGYMFDKTPIGGRPGSTSLPTEYVGTVPIYFMVGTSLLKEGYPTSNGWYDVMDISKYAVGSAGSYGLTTDENTQFNVLTNTLKTNWSGTVTNIMGKEGLDIPQKVTKEEETRIRTLFKTLAKIVNKHYSLSGEMKVAIDALMKDGVYEDANGWEYVFLIEPIHGMNNKSTGSIFGITPMSLTETHLSSSGMHLSNKGNTRMDETWRNIKNTQLYRKKTFESVINYWLGTETDLEDSLTKGQSIASKIYFSGPKWSKGINKEGEEEIDYAIADDKKYGWGIIQPSSLLKSNKTAETYYGDIKLSSPRGAVSKFSVPMESARSIKSAELVNTSDGGYINLKTIDLFKAADLSARHIALARNTGNTADYGTAMVFNIARTAEVDVFKLPTEKNLRGLETEQIFGADNIMQKDKLGDSKVTISNYLADNYKQTVGSVIGVASGLVEYFGGYSELSGLTASIISEASRGTSDALNKFVSNRKAFESGFNPLVSRKDNSIPYGPGNYGAFDYIIVNNVDLSKEMGYQYNKVLASDKVEVGRVAGSEIVNISKFRSDADKVKFYTNPNKLENNQFEALVTALNNNANDKAEWLNNQMIVLGLSDKNNYGVIETTGKDGKTTKDGVAPVNIALHSPGIPVVLEVIAKTEDGYSLLEFDTGKYSLDLGVEVPQNILGSVPVPKGLTLLDGTVLDTSKLAIRHSSVDTEKFAEKFIEDLESGNKTTMANELFVKGLEVPIVDYSSLKESPYSPTEKAVQIAGRDDDLSTMGGKLGLVLVVEPAKGTTVVKVYQDKDGNHTDTVIEKTDKPKYEIKDDEKGSVIEWFPTDKAPSPLDKNTPWDEIKDIPPTSPGGKGEGVVDIEKLKPPYIFVRLEEAKTVVKVYENEKGEHIETIIEKPSGPSYDIKDEGNSKVEEWFTGDTKPSKLDKSTSWSDVSNVPVTGPSGSGSDTLDLSKLKPPYIYIRYVKDATVAPPSPVNGNIIIKENEIGKQFTLYDINKRLNDVNLNPDDFGWGAHLYDCGSYCNCSCDDDDEGHSSSCDCNGDHPCYGTDWIDTSYSVDLVIEDSYNKEVVATNSGDYKFKYSDQKESGDVLPYPVIKKPNSMQVAYRGKDRPTLAKYKAANKDAIGDLSPLKIKASNVPASRTPGNKTDNTSLVWKEAGSDLRISRNCNVGHEHEASLVGKLPYNATVAIEQYLGNANKGDSKATTLNTPSVTMNGKEIKNLTQLAVPRDTVSFYPYIQMQYDTTDAAGLPAYVLAYHKSTFRPNDYVELGWTNKQLETGKPSLLIDSKQWSTHKMATSGSEWRKKNRVLPGGAMYDIATPKGNETVVGLASYFTYVPEDLIKAVPEYALGGLTLEPKKKVHADNVKDLTQKLDKLAIQMMVNKNYSKGIMESEGAIKVKQGASVNLDGNRTLNNSAKYWLQNDNLKKSTSSDFDVKVHQDTVAYYKVRADKNGNIVLEKSVDNVNWATKGTYPKTSSLTSIVSTMPADFKKVNDRTKLVTNFVNSVDRNKGAGDWYNEAWDGICVAAFETTLEVAFTNPSLRKSIIDTRLTPKFTSQRDMFTKAYSWGYKVEDKPIGITFLGNALSLKNVDKMHKSDKFFIPNATVMDLD